MRVVDYETIPRSILLLGPFLILGLVIWVFVTFAPIGNLDAVAESGTTEILLTLTMIGLLVGIIPVVIGMLWFPFLQTLDARYIHVVLALSAGVLAFVGVEMLEEAIDYAAGAPSPPLAAGIAIVAFAMTFAVMVWMSRWSHRTIAANGNRGLGVAYLIALGLGLHSLGEGIAIGGALLTDEGRLALLLIIGFVLDNVTEGPTVVAAIARDTDRPPLFHFLILGTIAGGPVILGGWLAVALYSPLLAATLLAVGIGAIAQVIWEVADLIRFDAGHLLDRSIATGFAGGFLFMFVLDEIFIDLVLLG